MNVLRQFLILRKHVTVLLIVALALLSLLYSFNKCLDIIESIIVTFSQDETLQDLYWQHVIDSRIVKYQNRLETAIRCKEWQIASDELKQLYRTVELRRRLFNVPEINVEVQIKQYEALIHKGINSYSVEKRTQSTYQSQSLVRGRINSWESSRFAPRSNAVQQDLYRVPSKTGRSFPNMSHQQEE